MSKKKEEIGTALPSLALVFGYIAIKELQRPKDRVDGTGNLVMVIKRLRKFVVCLKEQSPRCYQILRKPKEEVENEKEKQ